MTVVYAQEYPDIKDSKSIFLAGPTPRSEDVPSWRPGAIQYLTQLGFSGTVFVPEMRNGWNRDFEYSDQIEWEEAALHKADIIIFWIPRELNTMPAFTTNIEWGYWVATEPGKLILGYPELTCKMDYIKYYAEKLSVPIYNNLTSVVAQAIIKLK